MDNIEEIVNALRNIQSDSSKYEVALKREYGYIKNTQNKVISGFSNQQEGQVLASSLFTAMERTYDAYCEMYSLSLDIEKIITKIER